MAVNQAQDYSYERVMVPEESYFSTPNPGAQSPDNPSQYSTSATSRTSPLDDADGISTRSLLRTRSSAYSYAPVYTVDSLATSGTTLQASVPPSELEGGMELPRLRRNVKSKGSMKTDTVRSHSTFDGGLAVQSPGWWKRQMLVDRSLRSMAAVTTIFAVITLILVFIHLQNFIDRPNKNTTSVGGNEESCTTVSRKNTAIHLLINVAATIILGMSNTYQQLVTALDITDIKGMLQKRGDSRVGTNSPFSINHKTSKRKRSWLAWLMLILTSFVGATAGKTVEQRLMCSFKPIHFLANSVIGISYFITPPSNIVYNMKLQGFQSFNNSNVDCWIAFRSGSYRIPVNSSHWRGSTLAGEDPHGYTINRGDSYATIQIDYSTNCTSLRSTDPGLADFEGELYYSYDGDIGAAGVSSKNCWLGQHVQCRLLDKRTDEQCRLTVRYQAAVILAACLLIKAVYMIAVNLRARHHYKTKLLTFGDVMVASVIYPELQVKNECLVGAGEAYRQHVQHTCHKHCNDTVSSATGDEIGHCQKCKSFNLVDKAAGLEHPIVATKYKKSLISNLGFTAVTQMIILMLCSFAMLGLSIMVAVLLGMGLAAFRSRCREELVMNGEAAYWQCIGPDLTAYWATTSGTWGGFNSSASISTLPSDKLSSEISAFAISNGAQFVYSLLYLLLVYNITLVTMEYEWGRFESLRGRLRCTIIKGRSFKQSYLLQLPKKILFPLMVFSATMHWLLGQAISTKETVYHDPGNSTYNLPPVEHSFYEVTYAAYPVWLSTVLMLGMTAACWWAFSYSREGYIPQMYGSIRVLCAATTGLDEFPHEGVIWGDLGKRDRFRHAGFTAMHAEKIVPGELYCGHDGANAKTTERNDEHLL